MNAASESPFRTHEAEGLTESFEPETPFLDTRFVSEAWQTREAPAVGSESEQQWSPQLETPFVSQYHGETPVNLEAQMVEQAVTDFFDHDFNEAVVNLATEAAAQAERLADGAGETQAYTQSEAGTQQLLAEWIDPLREAMEQMFERVGAAASQQQLENYTEPEFEAFFASFAPQPGAVAPEFEDFLGKAWRKLKKIGKGVFNVIKKGVAIVGKLAMPFGFLLKKLARLVRPLINRVLRFALNKVPAELRPAATLLGKRLGILRETGFGATETELPSGEAPTMPEAEAIAQAFDAEVAMLMFSRDENEGELLLNEANGETQGESEASPLAELDAARERFVAEFSRLQPGDNPQPVIQQFIPAVLPLLRVAITVIGRDRVVNFLARFLAKMATPLIGREPATAISRFLISNGLRMIALEAESGTQGETDPRVAARAVAATLEDTMRRMSEFGFEGFDNLGESLQQQQVLETVASEAYFEAALAHIPAELLDGPRLAEREMYFETSGEVGVWAYRPRPRYKKYTRIFEVTITPQIAAQLNTFSGQPLAGFFRSHGIKLPAKLKVHLYEAIPGTMLSRISLLERRTPGLGSGSVAAFSKIHPLTTQAAALLLREPALGRDVAPAYLVSRTKIAVGQRFFYIESVQARSVGRPSEVNLTIDLPSNQVRVSVFFSEADAQRIVATGPSAGAMTAFRISQSMLVAVVSSLTSGSPSQHVRFNREAVGELEGEDFWQRIVGEAARRALRWLWEELKAALLQMVKDALIRYFNGRMAEFAGATRNPADGVTLVLVAAHPGLQVLRAALAGRVPGVADVRAAARKLQLPSASIVPGFVRR